MSKVPAPTRSARCASTRCGVMGAYRFHRPWRRRSPALLDGGRAFGPPTKSIYDRSPRHPPASTGRNRLGRGFDARIGSISCTGRRWLRGRRSSHCRIGGRPAIGRRGQLRLRYHSKLWCKEDAGRAIASLLPQCNVVVCGKDDPEGLFGLAPHRRGLSRPEREKHTAELLRQHFDLDCVAMTFRQASRHRSTAGRRCFAKRTVAAAASITRFKSSIGSAAATPSPRA